jgi:hypothetical protein
MLDQDDDEELENTSSTNDIDPEIPEPDELHEDAPSMGDADILRMEHVLPTRHHGTSHRKQDGSQKTEAAKGGEAELKAIFAEIMASSVDINDPQNYHKAMTQPDAEEWKKAMRSEWDSLLENNTFGRGTDVIGEHDPVSCKWVYKKEINHDGRIRYKARLVFQGFQQVAGVDYDETYAPISKPVIFHFLMSVAARQN